MMMRLAQTESRSKMHLLKYRASIKRFAHDSTGAAVIEYALALAMIGGGLAVFVESTGAAVNDVSEEMAASLARVENSDFNHPTKTLAAGSAKALEFAAESPSFPLDPLWWRVMPLVVASATLLLLFAVKKRKPPEKASQLERKRITIPDEQLFKKRQQILRLLKNDRSTIFEGRITAKHIMSHSLCTVRLESPVSEVCQLMKVKKIRHVLVCGANDELLGLISDRDMRETQWATAADLMTPDPVYVDSSTPLDPAVTLLMKRQISCLPVVDNGKLVGLLTSTDLLMALQSVSHILKQLAVEMALPAGKP